jgi:hypothetical protein
MTNTVLIKRSSTANSIPAAGNLQAGELALNYTDGNLFYKNSSNVVTVIASNQFVSVSGNVTGGNILTSGLVSATGTVTGSSFLGSVVSVTANITGGNLLTVGQMSATGTITSAGSTNGTAFAVGNGAVSNVALGMFPTAGTPGEYAIRDYSNVYSSMYFDVGIGGSANGAFQFRSSNAYRQFANINSSGINTSLAVSATGNVNAGNVISGKAVIANDFVVINSTSSTGEGGQMVLAWTNVNGLSSQANSTWNLDVDGSNNLRAFYQNAAGASGVLWQASPTSNIVSFPQSAGISATGNVTGNYFIGNGSQLTGIVASAGASIVNGTSNVVVAASGNIVANVAGAWSAQFISSGILANQIWANNNGNGTNFRVGDDVWIGDINVADTMSIRGQQNAANAYIVFGNADGTQLGRAGSGPLTYGGAFSATGNVTGGNLLTAGLISATSTITSAANITGGNLLTGGLVSATGTVTGSSHLGSVVSVTANVTGGNLLTGGIISATGRIFAASGNASAPGITFAADTSQDTGFYWISDGNIGITTNGTLRVTVDNNGNVSATGTVTGTSLLGSVVSASGNVTGGNILTGGLVSATANVTGGNILTGGLVSATANVTGGNILTGGLVSATGTVTGSSHLGSVVSVTANITGGNLLTGGLISATSTITSAANITGGNILTAGQISATGNVTGNYFVGNGAFLTGLSAGSSNGISNGATNISIPVSSGNIAMSVAGQSNTVVINLGSFTMYGTFAGPKTLNANVTVADSVNALLVGPVTIGNAYNITVPSTSTLYVYTP